MLLGIAQILDDLKEFKLAEIVRLTHKQGQKIYWDHSGITAVCFVRHLKKDAKSLRQAVSHVSKCEVCQTAFIKALKRRMEDTELYTKHARGWWTGDDPYLSEKFGVTR